MDTIQVCERCRECCRFTKKTLYYATLFTDEEKQRAMATGLSSADFISYRGSRQVFQVRLIPSVKVAGEYVCPLLDEQTHRCRIYEHRPLDCRLWPFFFMRSRNGRGALLASFRKDFCGITDAMKKKQYESFVRENSDLAGLLGFINRYPEFIWDYESYTFPVRLLKRADTGYVWADDRAS